jgi:[ribosomal protein S18]-alanine N-acetyltransferase
VVTHTIAPASAAAIDEIVNWQYGPPFELYDGDGIPPNNPERFFEVRDERGELTGFYYFERRGDAVFYGLGLRPDLTGRALGEQFVRDGLAFARERFGTRKIILDVAAFNDRAIKVYERTGFRETGRSVRRFERWGNLEFVDMELAE